MGSLYNALYHTMQQRINSLNKDNTDFSVDMENAVIENKWRLIDKYYQEPEVMQCCICGNDIKTEIAEILTSRDIFGGGELKRYRCPHCDAIVGPNKMWDLTPEELSDEYKFHYRCNVEANTTVAEIETFMALKLEKGKKYLNYGCGAWPKTIEELRA